MDDYPAGQCQLSALGQSWECYKLQHITSQCSEITWLGQDGRDLDKELAAEFPGECLKLGDHMVETLILITNII